MNGKFNVPIGTKSAVILDTDDFVGVAALLEHAELRVGDFAKTLADCAVGDLVFIDPPYTVMHNMNGFVKYNERIFRWEDQVRLRDCILDAHQRGASIVMTNADHASVEELYKGIGTHQRLRRRSVISGKAHGRSSITELMVRL